MPRRAFPIASTSHVRYLAIITAAAFGGGGGRVCNAFLARSSSTVFQQHLLRRAIARAIPCRQRPRHQLPVALLPRKRWFIPAVEKAATRYQRYVSCCCIGEISSTDESPTDEKAAATRPWQGNGPDPLADVQLLPEEVALVGGVAQGLGEERRPQPKDHPGLEVWMNGPFQAPVPMSPVDILYLDDDIVVANKPSGLLCVPGRIEKDSLVTRVALELGHYRVDKMVVHRLDMATSGVVVMARSDAALKSLHQQFRERSIGKSYVAMVHGVLPAEEGEVDLPVCRNRACPPLHMVNHELGKPALTQWRVVERAADRTRVALVPVSGRSHQLRLHMDAIGHPILGDHFYGNKESLALANRCLLHAETLHLSHPVTGERLTFTAPCDF